jgi:beta-ketoacyl-acyl-carrier-protein synthase II
MERKRVVITGMGAVTALGSSLSQYWDGLVHGRSGIRRITQFDASPFPCQIAGEIPDFEVEKYIERKEARRLPRSAQIALAAAIQAVADANLPESLPDPERSGVVFGTAMGGIDKADEGIRIYREQGYSKSNPFHLPMSIPNLSGYLVSKQFQALGPNNTIVTACATGTQAVGEGAEYIRRNSADLVITGGVESLILDFAIGGFCIMRALPVNYNDQPELASRPFDAKREGFVFAEGAGVLILESFEHAKARGARIYAEVLGHASSNDGYHFAQPDPDGAGATRAMRWAIENAGIQPTDIEYINAHGTSTIINDGNETRVIKKVFGEHAYKLAVSSTKSMIGHAMGASGALEAIACVLAMTHGIIPPTINYETPDPDCDLDYVPNQARKQQVNTVLSNSFGLGGQNACIVLRKYG